MLQRATELLRSGSHLLPRGTDLLRSGSHLLPRGTELLLPHGQAKLLLQAVGLRKTQEPQDHGLGGLLKADELPGRADFATPAPGYCENLSSRNASRVSAAFLGSSGESGGLSHTSNLVVWNERTRTAKRLNNKAQARAAQPGFESRPTIAFTPKALHKTRCNAFGVRDFIVMVTQGAPLRVDPGLRCETPSA